MNIYKVFVDNGKDYEDLTERIYIIGANSNIEAEKIGMEYFNQEKWNTGKKSVAMPIMHTDNGYRINLEDEDKKCGINFMMLEKLQEIINFLKADNEGYDRDEIIHDILCEIEELKGYDSDEISLEWDSKVLMILCSFTDEFFDKIIEKVCNVLESYRIELFENKIHDYQGERDDYL